MHVAAIIAAAGRGRRLGAALPKQLLDVGGRSILARSVETFDACDRIDEIVLVLPEDLVAGAAALVGPVRTPLAAVAGGDRRQDSVASAFDRVSPGAGIIVIHDAARPFASDALIRRTIEAAAESGAAVAAVAARDTVKQAAGTGARRMVAATLAREDIFLAQTPQAFARAVLRDAIALGREGAEATDEAALAERAGHRVRLVEGEAGNIKITTENDLALARLLAGAPPALRPRAGTGYDLHRLEPGRPLILGGVAIPADRGPAGHSDGDPVCHAVTDAILGAACEGDIGRHFPDSDPRWQGASSLDLLRRALAIVRDAGFFVGNVDAVIVLERPKLAPHVPLIRERLAAALEVPAARVSVKAKTNEGMDAVGRGEAIAVHAVALLEGPAPGAPRRA